MICCLDKRVAFVMLVQAKNSAVIDLILVATLKVRKASMLFKLERPTHKNQGYVNGECTAAKTQQLSLNVRPTRGKKVYCDFVRKGNTNQKKNNTMFES